MTVREVRIEAALKALQDKEPGLLLTDELYSMAVAVIDALFPPSPIDHMVVADVMPRC